jgi:hypothetical protein
MKKDAASAVRKEDAGSADSTYGTDTGAARYADKMELLREQESAGRR